MGDGAGEEAGVEVEHVGEEVQSHFLVLLLWEVLELGLELFALASKNSKEKPIY